MAINTIEQLNLTNQRIFKKWQAFLKSLGITDFEQNELATIDATFGMFNETGDLVATGSVAGNVLKYVGVCNRFSTQGAHFNTIVSTLINYLAQQGIFHLFVFTKQKYSESFQHVGFSELAHTDSGAVLETGDRNVHDYLAEIPRISQQDRKTVAAIVMNANPFTLGHRYLVEQAARENQLLYIFIVNNDVSLLRTAERTQLVKKGVADLTNVKVINGGDYMVSYATFPAYFLPTRDDAIYYQTSLDARIFKFQIAPPLNIKTRYLGSEPKSRTTAIYNQVLKRELPPEVAVKVIERRKTDSGKLITATSVRQAIQNNQLDQIQSFVPETTYVYLKAHLEELQARLQSGARVAGN